MNFFEARAVARSGQRVRQIEWVDRWLSFDGAIWHLTPVNPVNRVSGNRRVVQTIDCDPQWWRAEWTTDDVPPLEEWLKLQLGLLPETHIYFYVDSSGSMDSELLNLNRTLFVLREHLADVLYGGNRGLAQERVKIQYLDDERWLAWMANPESYAGASAEENIIVFAILNESSPYLTSGSSSPNAALIEDYNLLVASFPNRLTARGKVLGVAINSALSTGGPEFVEQLENLFSGSGGFASYPMPPGIEYEVNWNGSLSVEYFLNQILEFMFLEPVVQFQGEFMGLPSITQSHGDGATSIYSPVIRLSSITQSHGDGTTSIHSPVIRLSSITQSHNDGTTVIL